SRSERQGERTRNSKRYGLARRQGTSLAVSRSLPPSLTPPVPNCSPSYYRPRTDRTTTSLTASAPPSPACPPPPRSAPPRRPPSDTSVSGFFTAASTASASIVPYFTHSSTLRRGSGFWSPPQVLTNIAAAPG